MRRSLSPRSTRRRVRCSRVMGGAASSALASGLPTLLGPKRRGPPIGRNFSDVTARWIIPRRLREKARSRDGSASVSIRVARYRRRSNCPLEDGFFLGEAASREEARELIVRYRNCDVATLLRAVAERWDEVLGTLQVATPDRSLYILLNRWLLYQTLACRVWARSAFYQAGGAFGFRDQLQDVMALALSDPTLARQHVLRAAARQFVERDVHH